MKTFESIQKARIQNANLMNVFQYVVKLVFTAGLNFVFHRFCLLFNTCCQNLLLQVNFRGILKENSKDSQQF